MSMIVPFDFESKTVRVLTDDHGEPLFVAKDVAEALGYKDPTTAVKTHCRGVQELHPIVDSLGRTQDARVIREPDLYRLIAGSTLPSAVEFERKVFEEILPTIRKTGSYSASPAQTHALPRPREVKEAFNCFFAIGKLCGFTGNMLALSANQATVKMTGIDPLAMMGTTHLLADARGRTYTPTELGKMMVEPLPPRAVNKLFEERGVQVHDIGGEWVPTDAAVGHYEWADTARRHHDGTPVKQLKWFASIMDALGIEYDNMAEAA